MEIYPNEDTNFHFNNISKIIWRMIDTFHLLLNGDDGCDLIFLQEMVCFLLFICTIRATVVQTQPVFWVAERTSNIQRKSYFTS